MFGLTQARQAAQVVQRWLAAQHVTAWLVTSIMVTIGLVIFAALIGSAALVLMLLWPVLGEVFPGVVTQGFIAPTLSFPTACKFVLFWSLVRSRGQPQKMKIAITKGDADA